MSRDTARPLASRYDGEFTSVRQNPGQRGDRGNVGAEVLRLDLVERVGRRVVVVEVVERLGNEAEAGHARLGERRGVRAGLAFGREAIRVDARERLRLCLERRQRVAL